jgi:hypothetical protein
VFCFCVQAIKFSHAPGSVDLSVTGRVLDGPMGFGRPKRVKLHCAVKDTGQHRKQHNRSGQDRQGMGQEPQCLTSGMLVCVCLFFS